MKIVWNDDAIEALQELYNYYKDINEKYALNLYNTIIYESERLLTFPRLAATERLLTNEEEEYRSLIIQKRYKIIYFVDEQNQTIMITRLWDCRQDPDKLQIKH